jgi:hypothetical protein
VGVSGIVVSTGAVRAAGVGGRVRVLTGGDGGGQTTRHCAAAAARRPRTRTSLYRRHLDDGADRVCARPLHHGGRALPTQRQVRVTKYFCFLDTPMKISFIVSTLKGSCSSAASSGRRTRWRRSSTRCSCLR